MKGKEEVRNFRLPGMSLCMSGIAPGCYSECNPGGRTGTYRTVNSMGSRPGLS